MGITLNEDTIGSGRGYGVFEYPETTGKEIVPV